MSEEVKLVVRIGSDPHRLIQIIQSMSDEEIEKYIERQALNIAEKDAVKAESGIIQGEGQQDRLRRLHRIKRMAKEIYLHRYQQLSKYKIRIKSFKQLEDRQDCIEIVGKKI